MIVHKNPFPPRTANTQGQVRDDSSCPRKSKMKLGKQVQVDSGGLANHVLSIRLSSLGLVERS